MSIKDEAYAFIQDSFNSELVSLLNGLFRWIESY